MALRENIAVKNDPALKAKRTALKFYLLILAIIFTIFLIFELLFDFLVPTSVAIFAPLIFIIPLIFLLLGYRTDLVLTFNMILIILLLEAIFLVNPRSYHVLIYWVGLIPILIVSLTKDRAARIWSVVFLFFIIGNGLYAIKYVGPYTLELFPTRFMAAGVIFWMVTYVTLRFFHIFEKRQKMRLEQQNIELAKLKAEIENQHRLLRDQHDEINAVNEELKTSNDYLEERIRERTRDLELKNEQLKEYAFINSHILRAPVARIIGLINLIKIEDKQNGEILDHLTISGLELDDVVGKINKALDDDTAMSRDSIGLNK